MVALRCTCEQGTNLWGEFWWIEGEHRWVFFDDEKTSETYTEQPLSWVWPVAGAEGSEGDDPFLTSLG
jgi:hypothetical protein